MSQKTELTQKDLESDLKSLVCHIDKSIREWIKLNQKTELLYFGGCGYEFYKNYDPPKELHDGKYLTMGIMIPKGYLRGCLCLKFGIETEKKIKDAPDEPKN